MPSTRAAACAGGSGYDDGQAFALWQRAEVLAALERAGEAVADADRALRIARRLQHRGWTANALRALGIAHSAAGDLDAAERAFHESLDASANVPMFTSWAASRLALVRLARGDTDVGHYVAQALAQGPPLSQFDARLAQVELAAARGDPAAPRLARVALDLAQRAGHLVNVPRLHSLAGPPHDSSGLRDGP